MRFKDNVILQYTVGTAVVVVVISFVLGLSLANWTTDLQIKKHIDLYPQIASVQLKYNPKILSYMRNPSFQMVPGEIEDFIADLKSVGEIFRVKIWDNKARVLWSDDASIIGKSFPDNEEYQKALKGESVYEVTKPDKTEQATEAVHDRLLEIYTPAHYQGKTIAVIEMYEAADLLLKDTQKSTLFIWLLVGLSGILLYTLLFLVFYRSHKRQKQISAELSLAQDVTIMTLAAVAETRDNETGGHILRTQGYVRLLAEHLRSKRRYTEYLNRETIELLYKSSPLHDIGKVGVPDSILLKPGKLTAEEFEEMKKHTTYGRDSMKISEEKLGSNSFLETAMEIAYTHHEKWDGSGYPNGLIGEEIPLSGRIMALADVYDALISKRVYKEAFTFEATKEIIVAGRGGHFDPELVDAFLELEHEFEKIALRFKD